MAGSSSTTSSRAPVGSGRGALAATWLDGQREHDARSVCGSTVHPDRPGMRLDEALRDRQPEADTPSHLPGALQTYERGEDPVGLHHRDAGAVIAHLETHRAVVLRHPDPDLGAPRRELGGILDEIRQDLLDLDVVELDRGEILGHVEPDRMAGGNRSHLAGDILDERPDVVPRLVRDQAPVLDPREIEEIAHDAVESKGFVLDGARELVALAVGPRDVALPQASRRREDRG